MVVLLTSILKTIESYGLALRPSRLTIKLLKVVIVELMNYLKIGLSPKIWKTPSPKLKRISKLSKNLFS